MSEKEEQWYKSIINDYIEDEPNDEEIMLYLDKMCDRATLARLEEHFRRNAASRLNMGILQQALLSPVLSKLEDQQSINGLLNILRDQTADYWVRGSIAKTLGNIGSAEVIPDLIAQLKFEEDHPWILECAAESLVKLRAIQAIPAIKIFLERENIDPQIRQYIVDALSEMEKSEVQTSQTTIAGFAQQIPVQILQYVSNLKELLKDWKLSNSFSIPAFGIARSSTQSSETEKVFAEGKLRVSEREVKKTKDLEIRIITPISELEGGLITISAGDVYRSTRVLCKRGFEYGTIFLIPAAEREKAFNQTELTITDIKTIDEITSDDLTEELKIRLVEMEKSESRSEKAAAQKVKKHIESLNIK